MSESTKNPVKGNRNQLVPRATVHKQILDTAESRPDAAMKDIASEVTGASTDLVEKVLEEYGDPATTDPPVGDREGSKSGERNDAAEVESEKDEPIESVDDVQLSEKQRKTLRAISENPEATQREIAAHFDVTAATISRRINSIAGFEWSNREVLSGRLLDTEKMESAEQERSAQPAAEFTDRIDELDRHIQRLEERLDEAVTQTESGLEDPELVVKIMHACLESNQVTKDEEVVILDRFITGNRN